MPPVRSARYVTAPAVGGAGLAPLSALPSDMERGRPTTRPPLSLVPPPLSPPPRPAPGRAVWGALWGATTALFDCRSTGVAGGDPGVARASPVAESPASWFATSRVGTGMAKSFRWYGPRNSRWHSRCPYWCLSQPSEPLSTNTQGGGRLEDRTYHPSPR